MSWPFCLATRPIVQGALKTLLALSITLAVLFSIPHLITRWQFEHQTRVIELVVDAQESRALTLRAGLSETLWTQQLAQHGVTGLLIAPQTFGEARRTRDTLTELARHGVRHLSNRSAQELRLLEDVEVGYDTDLIEATQSHKLNLYLRVNHDPWLTTAYSSPAYALATGFLFSSDIVPGGDDRASQWAESLQAWDKKSLLFEFRPTLAAQKIASLVPGRVVRGHTIPTAEMKDLSPAAERSRWLRAVEERSCTLLLIRPGPADSWDGFLSRIQTLHEALAEQNWRVERSLAYSPATATPALYLKIRLLLAWGVAVCAPLVALYVGWMLIQQKYSGWLAFSVTLSITLAGALVLSSLSWMTETRLQLTPFRGVKAAIILPWLFSGLLLFSLREGWDSICKPLKRLDLLVAILLIGIVGYGLLRSGNVSLSWKPKSEQSVRNYLEDTLPVRPRFKEFAVGIPLLLSGFLLAARQKKKRVGLDPRVVLWVGMMGPVSITNTFCHLHSPIALALARSGMGVLLGSLIGVLIYVVYIRTEGIIYEKK